MAIYQIFGGKQLSGRVAVSGSKNAALPIISATLLTNQKCVLKNVPDILDVRNLIKILEGLGSKISFEKNVLSIDNSGVDSFEPDPQLVKKLRGSILLLGPLLGRFKEAVMPFPGGDLIGKRPIDTHLQAFRDLGVTVEENGKLHLRAPKLAGAEVILDEMSVTATENAVMAAVGAAGQTEIHLADPSPHVQDLCNFLNALGANISGIGTNDLVISGTGPDVLNKMRGAEYAIISDNDVACSLMNLAAASRSEIIIENIETKFLRAAFIKFREMNVNFEVTERSITVKPPSGPYRAVKIKGGIYPNLMSDCLPPFAVLATQAEGISPIHEWMYEGRLGYIHELSKMGAKAVILDQHRAEITGPTKLHGTNVSSLDVRSGMVLVIAALVAEGKSVLHDVEHIERGYENLVGNLQNLGADIKRMEE